MAKFFKDPDGKLIAALGDIEWIALEAEGRLEVHYLEPGMKPATFFAGGSKTGTVYAYCNLHGLWSATF